MSAAQAVDWAAIGPPAAVVAAAVAALLVDAFWPGRRVALMAPTLGGPLAALGLTIWLAASGARRPTFCAGAACSYVVDDFTVFFQVLIFAAVVVVVLISPPTIHAERVPPGEYAFLMLTSAAGAATLVAARDLMTLVVALEVVSLPVFALTALRRYAPARGATAGEAALKLFLVSVISTAVMLFGVSLVYGTTGSLFLSRIAAAWPTLTPDLHPVLTVGAVLVIVGFGFKIAAVPFHFWAPDVYEGAPVPVAAYLSVVSKAAGFAGLILVLVVAFPQIAPTWGTVLAVLAAVTMTLGNLVALRQRGAVRLLAWSSVAQSGYMLSPLGIAAAGTAHLADALTATTTYLAIYTAMNLGAFAVVTAVATRHGAGALDDYRGLARTNPVLGIALGFFLLCLAGLPPGLAGLFAKIVVFRAALLGSLGWLALVIAVNTVIGLAYYLAWVVRLFTPPPAPAGAPGRRALAVPVPVLTGAAIALAMAAAVVLSVAPGVVMRLPLAALGG